MKYFPSAVAIWSTAILLLAVRAAHAEDELPMPNLAHPDGIMLISPLAGWNRNELAVHGPPGTPPVTQRDTSPEYGLFALYASPHLALNNMAFFTKANGADISGDVFFANVYGSPQSRCTWNVGAGYVWHKISTAATEIEVNTPIAKAGLLLRVPAWHLTLNPYLGYSWEDIETSNGNEDSESVLYGLTAGWRRRMLHATVKYYCEYNLDREERYNVLRLRAAAFFTPYLGIVARIEYMEHYTSDDTSVLLGPAFIF